MQTDKLIFDKIKKQTDIYFDKINGKMRGVDEHIEWRNDLNERIVAVLRKMKSYEKFPKSDEVLHDLIQDESIPGWNKKYYI